MEPITHIHMYVGRFTKSKVKLLSCYLFAVWLQWWRGCGERGVAKLSISLSTWKEFGTNTIVLWHAAKLS
jgi:hypothetical protein